MQWPNSRFRPASPASASASTSKSTSSISGVTAKLEASRLEDRRRAAAAALRRTRTDQGNSGTLIDAKGNDYKSLLARAGASEASKTWSLGLQFELADEIQAESRRRRQTAGPIPYSWSKVSSSSAATKSSNSGPRRAGGLPSSRGAVGLATPYRTKGKEPYEPTTLKQECTCLILRSLATDSTLLDEVAYLPFPMKADLLALAPYVAPLSDISIEALLLEDTADETQIGCINVNEENESVDGWETEIERQIAGRQELSPERCISELDLSYSSVSMSTLRRLILTESSTAPDQHQQQKTTVPIRALTASRARLPRLRKLDLSHSEFTIGSSIIFLIANLSITHLSLQGLHTNLQAPLKTLSQSLARLKHLDLGESAWLTWEDFAKVDWTTDWQELESVNVRDCPQLTPPPSYMNPEGKPLGPDIIMHIQGILRQGGRRKWLDIIA